MVLKLKKLKFPELEGSIRAAGHTYSSFEKLIKIPKGQLSKRLTGEVEIPISEAIDMSIALGKTMDELFINRKEKAKCQN